MSLRRDNAAEPTTAEPESGGSNFSLWGWLAAGLLAAVMLTFAWHWWTPSEWLAEKWQAELEEAPEAEVATRILQIAELGDAGIDSLVESLGSPREVVVEAARRELGNVLDHWELLPAAESSAKIAKLVAALKSRAAKWPAAPLRPAAELAHRALRWRLDAQSPTAMEIVAGCEAVLRASAALNRPTAAPVSLAVFADDPSAANPRDAFDGAGANSDILKHVAFDDPHHPPSADLPLDIFPLPAPPPWPSTDRRGAASPRALDPTDSGPTPINEPALLGPLPGRPLPLDGQTADGSDTIPNRSRAIAPSAEFTRLLAVMKNLHREAPAVAEAEAELRRAGFDDLRLEIARRITDPDPAKRRDLAEQLPRVPGLDARPWLLALAQDSNVSVASAASRVLATSSDPELQAAAREGMKR